MSAAFHPTPRTRDKVRRHRHALPTQPRLEGKGRDWPEAGGVVGCGWGRARERWRRPPPAVELEALAPLPRHDAA